MMIGDLETLGLVVVRGVRMESLTNENIIEFSRKGRTLYSSWNFMEAYGSNRRAKYNHTSIVNTR